MMAPMRDYAAIAAVVSRDGDVAARMRAVVDALWDTCHAQGVSWVGFYLPDGTDALVLGPSRDTPACSPIGLHGACGRVFRSAAPLVVRDVAELEKNYIACDPRDRSEVVVPLIATDGTCTGVLDLDSHQVAAFDASDVNGLNLVLRSAGLTQAS
jgi:putative methionine-R-sulfoxide reductase with GAF domain